MIEYLGYILIFCFVWFSVFFWHELFHIFSQGNKGRVVVDGYGMYCYADKVSDLVLFRLSGGIGASVLSFLLVFVTTDFWQLSFFVLGWVNLVYGVYEGFGKSNVRMVRYGLYVLVVVCSVVFWMVK